MFAFLEDNFDDPADAEDQAVMSCEIRVKVASMCLLWDAVWQPSLLEFLLAKGGDPICRASLHVQDAIVNSNRKTEEQNELISWVLQLAQRDICALAIAR